MMPLPGLGPARVRHASGAEEVLLIRWVSGSNTGVTIGAIMPADGVRIEVDVPEGSPVRVTELGSAAWQKAVGKPVPDTGKDPWAPERVCIPEFPAMIAVLDELGVRKWTGDYRLNRPGHEGDAERTATAILEEMWRGVPAREAALSRLEGLDWYRQPLKVEEGAERLAQILVPYGTRLRQRAERLAQMGSPKKGVRQEMRQLALF